MWHARSHPLRSRHVSLLSNQSRRISGKFSPRWRKKSASYIPTLSLSNRLFLTRFISFLSSTENLIRENSSLSNTVKRLQRDVPKLEGFRKTLMMSLQDDDQNAGTTRIIAKPTPNDDNTSFQPPRYSLIQSQASEVIESATMENENDAPKPSLSNSVPLLSQTNTPRLTPPGSPPTLSASATPKTTSRPLSPRRHSVSFSTTRGMFGDTRSSISISEPGSHTGRSRVDGKEFFRQVRSRLSYEQFGAFLGNVKDLNAHKQTREETLRKAEEIFGSDNRDLNLIFEGLITRNAH